MIGPSREEDTMSLLQEKPFRIIILSSEEGVSMRVRPPWKGISMYRLERIELPKKFVFLQSIQCSFLITNPSVYTTHGLLQLVRIPQW